MIARAQNCTRGPRVHNVCVRKMCARANQQAHKSYARKNTHAQKRHVRAKKCTHAQHTRAQCTRVKCTRAKRTRAKWTRAKCMCESTRAEMRARKNARAQKMRARKNSNPVGSFWKNSPGSEARQENRILDPWVLLEKYRRARDAHRCIILDP